MKYERQNLGPLLNEDSKFLQSIIQMTTPKVVVEFGHLWGDSAKAMLKVMEKDAVLHSYDNTKDAQIPDNRFIFHKQSQEEVNLTDIDFVFLDASHYLDLNQKTFLKLKDNMTPKGIIAVHDTGTWVGGNVFDAERGHEGKNGEWVHCPEELEFMNWIKQEHPEWQQIHFHSSRKVRHGITLLQKYQSL